MISRFVAAWNRGWRKVHHQWVYEPGPLEQLIESNESAEVWRRGGGRYVQIPYIANLEPTHSGVPVPNVGSADFVLPGRKDAP